MPGRPTLRVRGLRADGATDLALGLGRTTWNAAPYEALTIAAATTAGVRAEPAEWVLGWPRGVDDVARLHVLVLKS
ncbi:MAG: hypothetical protein Q7T56_17935 [Nocardioidaceae bacterium]|nr:hypothetical protein [Nocardioidaceae bacterium]